MRNRKMIMLDKTELVDMLSEKALEIVNDVLIEAYGDEIDSDVSTIPTWDYYDKKQFNKAFHTLKNKQQQLYNGKSIMLSELVSEFDIRINPRAHFFLQYMKED